MVITCNANFNAADEDLYAKQRCSVLENAIVSHQLSKGSFSEFLYSRIGRSDILLVRTRKGMH